MALATPEAVETELEYKMNLTPEDLKFTKYMGQYDRREEGFTCAEDHLSGQLFMLEKVSEKSKDKDLSKTLTQGMFQKVIGAMTLNKVTVNMNNQKLSISDMNKELKEIIRLDTVYPRMDQIQEVLDSKN